MEPTCITCLPVEKQHIRTEAQPKLSYSAAANLLCSNPTSSRSLAPQDPFRLLGDDGGSNTAAECFTGHKKPVPTWWIFSSISKSSSLAPQSIWLCKQSSSHTGIFTQTWNKLRMKARSTTMLQFNNNKTAFRHNSRHKNHHCTFGFQSFWLWATKNSSTCYSVLSNHTKSHLCVFVLNQRHTNCCERTKYYLG